MKNILVVEDTKTDALVILNSLSAEGFNTIHAESSEDAQAKIQAQKPDLILIDVILPGKNGFELCRELQGKPDTSDIPLVICSAKDNDIDKYWGMKQGAIAYLTKPINANQLITVVKQNT